VIIDCGLFMYFNEDDDDFSLADWQEWTITFYGSLPRAGKESEGGLLMKNDAFLNEINWRFPKNMPSGWIAQITVNGESIHEIDISKNPHSSLLFEPKIVLMKGNVVSAHIFHVEPLTDEITESQINSFTGKGYNILMRGVQRNDSTLSVDEAGESNTTMYSRWQIDMA